MEGIEESTLTTTHKILPYEPFLDLGRSYCFETFSMSRKLSCDQAEDISSSGVLLAAVDGS